MFKCFKFVGKCEHFERIHSTHWIDIVILVILLTFKVFLVLKHQNESIAWQISRIKLQYKVGHFEQKINKIKITSKYWMDDDFGVQYNWCAMPEPRNGTRTECGNHWRHLGWTHFKPVRKMDKNTSIRQSEYLVVEISQLVSNEMISFCLIPKVCLQFPDDLIPFSIQILEDLKKNTTAQLCILGDTSYGSCCVDEVSDQMKWQETFYFLPIFITQFCNKF